MIEKKRAAFIKTGNFSHTNESVLQILTNNFPDIQIDVVDVFKDLISKRDLLALFFCIKDYGFDILLGIRTISGSYFRTSYIFNKIKKAVQRKLASQNYIFTFQTQSIFDASILGVPHFLYTDHTHLVNLKYPGFDPKQLVTKKWIGLEEEIYQHATLNFTMSTNISRSIIEDYSCNPDKVVCVYCGSNVQVAENEIFDEARFSKRNILFVGIDWIRKGGPVLIDAFRTVLDIYPDATLTIVGCSPGIKMNNLNIVGRIPLNEVKKYFEKASLFCLPTTIEPLGIVFLEAMAHKLPVIGTNIGAIPDFIHEGKNGHLVEPNNSEQLSDKIIELLGSHQKSKVFGEYGHKIFWDRYTWEKTGIRMRENILRVLN